MWIVAMPKTSFTVVITIDDIVNANVDTPDTSYTNPVAKAVKRLLSVDYPNSVRVGWGYASIYYESETHNYLFQEGDAVGRWIWSWQSGKSIEPRDFVMVLESVKERKGLVTSPETPRKYSKAPPRVSKTGM